MNRIVALARSAPPLAITLALITVALAAAVLSNAPLLYDGSFFLYQAVNAQAIQIPQLRITFGWLQWPVVIASHLTDSFAILRIVYGIPIVAGPLVGMALSWWVVRRDRPQLIIWPALGILLIDLPGQMHWIATSIRTNQLFWPILLAVFIGMPDRVVPGVFMLTIVVLLLHPQVSMLLLAATAAALFLAWRQPEHRKRLLMTALCLGFAGIYRAGAIQAGYESSEMSLANQQRQWESAVAGLPAWALGAVAIAAIAIALGPRLPALRQWLGIIAGVALAISGLIFLTWANDPDQWKTAIDYRGPSLILSLVLMGLAFLDAVVRTPVDDTQPDTLRQRLTLMQAASLVFCLTIVVQSLSWRGELADLRTAMVASETPCVPLSAVPDNAANPANFWSLPAMSLMLQDRAPDRVILPDHLCEQAIQTGTIPIALYAPADAAPSNRIDLMPLRWSMAAHGACWMRLTTGWHENEPLPDGWLRWSTGEGTVRILVGADATAMLTGRITTLPRPNKVSIVVNGETQRVIDLPDDRWTPLDGTPITLTAGENTIAFVSEEPAGHAPPDPRDLAVAVISLNITVPSLRSQCAMQ